MPYEGYAGLVLLALIAFFAAIVLIRRHYRKECGGKVAAAGGRPNNGFVPIPDAWSVEKRLKNIIADHMGIDANNIRDSGTLADLGADSLDVVEIVMECEDGFKVKMTEEQESSFSCLNVCEIASLLRELGAKDGEPEHLSSTGGH